MQERGREGGRERGREGGRERGRETEKEIFMRVGISSVPLPVGLLMEQFPRTDNKWYILATTPCRVYQFIGLVNTRNEPQFMELFTFYNDQVKGVSMHTLHTHVREWVQLVMFHKFIVGGKNDAFFLFPLFSSSSSSSSLPILSSP